MPGDLEADEQHMCNNAHSKKRKRLDSNEDASHGQQQQWRAHERVDVVSVLGPGHVGEVAVTGAGLAAGYYRSIHHSQHLNS